MQKGPFNLVETRYAFTNALSKSCPAEHEHRFYTSWRVTSPAVCVVFRDQMPKYRSNSFRGLTSKIWNSPIFLGLTHSL